MAMEIQQLESNIEFAQYHLSHHPASYSDHFWHNIIQQSITSIKHIQIQNPQIHNSFPNLPSSIPLLTSLSSPKPPHPPNRSSPSYLSSLSYPALRIPTPPTSPPSSFLTHPTLSIFLCPVTGRKSPPIAVLRQRPSDFRQPSCNATIRPSPFTAPSEQPAPSGPLPAPAPDPVSLQAPAPAPPQVPAPFLFPAPAPIPIQFPAPAPAPGPPLPSTRQILRCHNPSQPLHRSQQATCPVRSSPSSISSPASS